MPIRWTYTGAVALSALLAVLSAFLSWASVTITVPVPILGRVRTINFYGYETDGIIVLLLGLLAAGVAAYLWYDPGVSAFRLGTLFTAFLGALIFAVALISLLDTERAVGSTQRKLGLGLEQFLDIDAGAGIYIAMAAGLLAAAASLAAFAAQRIEPFASLFEPPEPRGGREAPRR